MSTCRNCGTLYIKTHTKEECIILMKGKIEHLELSQQNLNKQLKKILSGNTISVFRERIFACRNLLGIPS